MRIVLAYSGGLDTTVAISLLRERLGAEVITVTSNVGQKDDYSEIEKRAYRAGAVKHYTFNDVDTFAEEYVAPCIIMNCSYEEKYPLGTALARPLIALRTIEVAKKEGADAIAHGSTSKGNDQVRFDLTILAEAPDKEIFTPVRKWRLTREWEIEYASKKGLPIKTEHKKYSIDENLWTRSIEGGPIDDSFTEPSEDAFEWTSPPHEAPDEPRIIELGFKEGMPHSIDGQEMKLAKLVEKLNQIAGIHGVGRIDMIENRLVGLKSREVYEAPAAVTILEAHRDLEKTVLTPREYRFKRTMDSMWSDLVYTGLWYEPLRKTLQDTGYSMNKWVTGVVKVKLYKGSLMIVGRSSEYSLYDPKAADYDKGWYPSEEEAVGFIKIWGLHSLHAHHRRSGKSAH